MGENATDSAALADLVEDYITLVACPAPSCKDSLALWQRFTYQHQLLFAIRGWLALDSLYVQNSKEKVKKVRSRRGRESSLKRVQTGVFL